MIRIIALGDDQHDDPAERPQVDRFVVMHEMMNLLVAKADNIQFEILGRT